MIPAVAPAGDGLPTGQPPGPGRVPLVGQLVQVRSRHWLVEKVQPARHKDATSEATERSLIRHGMRRAGTRQSRGDSRQPMD